ncbi:MAG: hypothetical protein FJX59_15590, partial [Alphaproteobacteria bacterium]|nr:hypothetical protein [Alphaproteobacteria bacterium]
LITLAILITLANGATAQNQVLPQRTIQHQVIAERIVSQLHLEPGEKVISVAMPGYMNEFIPHIRYAVMKAGGVDLGVIEALKTPYPEEWDAATIRAGLDGTLKAYVKMLEDADVGIMLPGTNPAHSAYRAMQRIIVDKRGPRRTIHFHWTDPYGPLGSDLGLSGVNIMPGHPAPAMQTIDAVYQNAILNTDLKALGEHQRRFVEAMKRGPVRVTTPLGTDLKFEIMPGRPIIIQDGDASAKNVRNATTLVEREVEIPAGVVRVAPREDSTEGVIAYGPSRWSARSVEGAKVYISKGKITRVTAGKGVEFMRAELDAQPEAVRMFREMGLGFNPLLTVPERDPWIPYYGYGAGVVRLGIGNNAEIGGAITAAPYNRWRDLFIDCTITLDGEVWVKDGKFVR